MNADALAEQSLSFRMFKEWFDQWPSSVAAI